MAQTEAQKEAQKRYRQSQKGKEAAERARKKYYELNKEEIIERKKIKTQTNHLGFFMLIKQEGGVTT